MVSKYYELSAGRYGVAFTCVVRAGFYCGDLRDSPPVARIVHQVIMEICEESYMRIMHPADEKWPWKHSRNGMIYVDFPFFTKAQAAQFKLEIPG